LGNKEEIFVDVSGEKRKKKVQNFIFLKKIKYKNIFFTCAFLEIERIFYFKFKFLNFL
jgi:hypothetical protein